MKTKLLAVLLLAGASAFAQTRFSVSVGTYNRGYYAAPVQSYGYANSYAYGNGYGYGDRYAYDRHEWREHERHERRERELRRWHDRDDYYRGARDGYYR